MKALPQPLRRRVNRLAHALAAAHEQHQREVITSRLLGLAAGGARFSDLDGALVQLEQASYYDAKPLRSIPIPPSSKQLHHRKEALGIAPTTCHGSE